MTVTEAARKAGVCRRTLRKQHVALQQFILDGGDLRRFTPVMAPDGRPPYLNEEEIQSLRFVLTALENAGIPVLRDTFHNLVHAVKKLRWGEDTKEPSRTLMYKIARDLGITFGAAQASPDAEPDSPVVREVTARAFACLRDFYDDHEEYEEEDEEDDE
jgi:hypothetical protein